MTLEHLSLALGLIGLSCFLWPILMRVAGKAPPAASGGQALRSPLWWAGLVLTAAAVFIQRMAQGGAA